MTIYLMNADGSNQRKIAIPLKRNPRLHLLLVIASGGIVVHYGLVTIVHVHVV